MYTDCREGWVEPQVFLGPHPGNTGQGGGWWALGWSQEIVSLRGASRSPWPNVKAPRSGGMWSEGLSASAHFWNSFPSPQPFLYCSAYLFKEPIQALRPGYNLFLWCLVTVSRDLLRTQVYGRRAGVKRSSAWTSDWGIWMSLYL